MPCFAPGGWGAHEGKCPVGQETERGGKCGQEPLLWFLQEDTALQGKQA